MIGHFHIAINLNEKNAYKLFRVDLDVEINDTGENFLLLIFVLC